MIQCSPREPQHFRLLAYPVTDAFTQQRTMLDSRQPVVVYQQHYLAETLHKHPSQRMVGFAVGSQSINGRQKVQQVRTYARGVGGRKFFYGPGGKPA